MSAPLLMAFDRAPPGRVRDPPPGPDRASSRLPPGRASLVLLFCRGRVRRGFVAVFAHDSIPHQTQFLGLSLGLALALLAAALSSSRKRLVPPEELEEHVPGAGASGGRRTEIAQLVEESGEPVHAQAPDRGRARGAAGTALGAALVAPARLARPRARPAALFAHAVAARAAGSSTSTGRPLARRRHRGGPFYTAYPEGADREQIGAPLVVVRLPSASSTCPRARAAGRRTGSSPTRRSARTRAVRSRSTASRRSRRRAEPGARLPVPLLDVRSGDGRHGHLRAGRARRCRSCPCSSTRPATFARRGNFSGPVGPSWWGVRTGGDVVIRGRPLPRRAHRHGAVPEQGAPLRLPRPLVVPARRGRALLLRPARRDRAST